MTAEPKGGIWIGTQMDGVHHWKDEELCESINMTNGLADNWINVLLTTSAGELWIGTGRLESPLHFLQRRQAGQFQTFQLPEDCGPVVALSAQPGGDCWAATAGGRLLWIRAGALTDETRSMLTGTAAIRSLLATTDGTLWIGYGGQGLGRLKDGRFSRYRSAQGLSDDCISQMVADGRGRMWFAGNRGIFSVREQELADLAEGRAARVRSTSIGQKEGLTGLQASYDAGSCAQCGADGRLLFAMQSGVAIVHAAEVIEVINVNCGGHAWEPESTMKGRANPTDRGVAPVAYRGVIWSEGFGWNRTKLKNSEDKPTTVGFHVDTIVGCAQDWRNNKLTLLIGGWHDANKTPLDISGLDKFNRYDLYLPSQDDYGRNKGGEFTISNVSDAGTNTLISTGKNLNGATWVEGEDYVVFKNIAPSDEGGIHLNFSGTLNGFQLVKFDPRKPSTTSLKQTTGSNKSTFGDRLTFTATVDGEISNGKVIFYDGDVPLESQIVNQSFTASLVTDVFAGGTHQLSARYEGDPKNSPSRTTPISLLVTDHRPATTTTLTLASGSDHPTYGEPVTFTATVAGTKKPSGKVIFYDYEGKEVTPISYYDSRYGKGAALASNDLPPLGAKTLDASLKVDITIKDLPWGRHSITAKYAGDIHHAPSSSAASAMSVKPRVGNGKLKVFILAGQSNMEGHGAVDSGGKVGPYYGLMTEKVHQVLNNLKDYCPASSESRSLQRCSFRGAGPVLSTCFPSTHSAGCRTLPPRWRRSPTNALLSCAGERRHPAGWLRHPAAIQSAGAVPAKAVRSSDAHFVARGQFSPRAFHPRIRQDAERCRQDGGAPRQIRCCHALLSCSG